MATIYVTTNAASGDGSLAAAVAAAQDGDVIKLGSSQYPWGNYCHIELLETLVFSHDVTIAECGAILEIYYAGTAFVIDGAAVTLNDTDFACCGTVYNSETSTQDPTGTHGYIVSITNGGELVLNRSHFYGCYSGNHANGGTLGVVDGKVTLNNCVVTGCYAKNGAIFSSSTTGNELHINDSTIIGNIPRDIYATASTTVSVARSIYQSALNVPAAVVSNSITADPSTIGFVAAPPNEIDAAAWDGFNAFGYILYLAPNSTARTGRGGAGGKDIDLLPRRANGAIGAYEYFDADYYIDAEGKVSTTYNGTFATITENNISGNVYLIRTYNFSDYIDLNGATISSLILPGFCVFRGVYGGYFGTLQTPGTFILGEYSELSIYCDNVINITDYIKVADMGAASLWYVSIGGNTKIVGTSTYADWSVAGYKLVIGDDGDTVATTIEFLDDLPSGLNLSIVTCGEYADNNKLILHNDVAFTSVYLSFGDIENDGFISVSDDYVVEAYGLVVTGSGTITCPILAIDPTTPLTDLTTTATVCDYGAGLTSFTATPDGDSIDFSWTKTDASRAVLIQQNQDGVWTTLAAKASGTTLTAGDPEGGVECRAFDGVQFFRSAGSKPAGWLAILGALYGVRNKSTLGE